MRHLKLTICGAEAMAWHLEKGEDNAGLSRQALADWLRDLVDQLRLDCHHVFIPAAGPACVNCGLVPDTNRKPL